MTRDILIKAKKHADICSDFDKHPDLWWEKFFDSVIQLENQDKDDAWNYVSEVGLPKYNHGTYAIAYKSKSLLTPIEVCTSELSYFVSPKDADKDESNHHPRFCCWDRPDFSNAPQKFCYPILVDDVIAWKLLTIPTSKR